MKQTNVCAETRNDLLGHSKNLQVIGLGGYNLIGLCVFTQNPVTAY